MSPSPPANMRLSIQEQKNRNKYDMKKVKHSDGDKLLNSNLDSVNPFVTQKDLEKFWDKKSAKKHRR